jgi:pimeloyl-ACP methyl ester carboxylesterase
LRPIGAVVPSNALALAASWGEHSVIETMPGLLPQFAKLRPEDREFRRWALQALLTWQPPALGFCPLYQIHGEHDATFSAACSGADTIVANAGHLLTLTHAEIVNDYLRSVINRCSEK